MSIALSCLRAESIVAFVAEELVRRGVVTSWIAADTVERVVTRCSSCRGSKPHANKCTGWRIRFGRPTTTLRFQPVNVEGHEVEVRLECDLDFSSKYPSKKRDWSAAPMCTCIAAIELYEPGTENLLTRQHLDLANLDQAGPVWHLQLGGKPAEGSKPNTLWLKVPRWPVAPTEFILVVEFVLFSFFPAVWRGVAPSTPWRDYIKSAEQLVLPHYRDRLVTYLNVSATAHSWLAAQENHVSAWNPRPAK